MGELACQADFFAYEERTSFSQTFGTHEDDGDYSDEDIEIEEALQIFDSSISEEPFQSPVPLENVYVDEVVEASIEQLSYQMLSIGSKFFPHYQQQRGNTDLSIGPWKGSEILEESSELYNNNDSLTSMMENGK